MLRKRTGHMCRPKDTYNRRNEDDLSEMVHKTRTTWVNKLFECRNLHKYVCAMLCPCVPANTIRRRLMREHGNSDIESSAAAAITTIPLVVGAMRFNQEIEQGLQNLCNGQEGEYDDDKVNAECVLCSCLMYPCLICATTCVLRSYAIEQLNIKGESCCKTTLLSALCWPCVLIQTEEEIQGHRHESERISMLLGG